MLWISLHSQRHASGCTELRGHGWYVALRWVSGYCYYAYAAHQRLDDDDCFSGWEHEFYDQHGDLHGLDLGTSEALMSTVTSNAATVVKMVFDGLSAAGAVSATGLMAGDVLMRCLPDGFESGFEPVVSANDELQQTRNLDWSSVTFTAYFLRGV
jgi:hypothetical protein